MTPLEKILKQQIALQGPITVAEFMTQALSHPEHGYYTSKNPIGTEGDFTTAPEISQMFGEMIAAWMIDVWQKLGCPQTLHLIEMGPGRGTLMADILRVAQDVLPDFYTALSVHLVEINTQLIEAQKTLLKSHQCISWRKELRGIQLNDPVIIIGNEFLDALPIHQYQKAEEGWAERVVSYREDAGFYFGLTPTTLNFGNAMVGQVREVSPVQANMIKEICDLLKTYSGSALFIDYGHSKSGFGDTLQALKKHQYCDPLSDIGAVDLTSHVDFETLSSVSAGQGVSPSQIVTQAVFLTSLGIQARADMLSHGASEPQKKQIAQDLQRLISRSEMGDLFKVMAISYPDNIAPEGFGT